MSCRVFRGLSEDLHGSPAWLSHAWASAVRPAKESASSRWRSPCEIQPILPDCTRELLKERFNSDAIGYEGRLQRMPLCLKIGTIDKPTSHRSIAGRLAMVKATGAR